jgi:hypothetical protein
LRLSLRLSPGGSPSPTPLPTSSSSSAGPPLADRLSPTPGKTGRHSTKHHIDRQDPGHQGLSRLWYSYRSHREGTRCSILSISQGSRGDRLPGEQTSKQRQAPLKRCARCLYGLDALRTSPPIICAQAFLFPSDAWPPRGSLSAAACCVLGGFHTPDRQTDNKPNDCSVKHNTSNGPSVQLYMSGWRDS